ncbi:MAG: HipA domain-containing protein, partial [Thermodesulfobacteriota bacterium]|nr:HipA domain-containing protein [Thermodesulfobacteriota bacterium]
MSICKISLKLVKHNAKYHDYKDSEFRKLFGSVKIKPCLPFIRQDFFTTSPIKSKGMSISGVQQKLSLKINKDNELIITAVNGEYILKPSPEAFPHAAENEHCGMLAGKLIGIETALCGLIPFPDGELAYITKRFDRMGHAKIHQEDMVQGFGLKSDEKYAYSYEKTGRLLNKMVNGKIAVIMEFFRRVLHAYIIGNDDMHLKNISVQKFPDNTGRYYDYLTPNYDSLFTTAFANSSNLGFFAIDLLEDEADGIFSKKYKKYGFYTGFDFKDFGEKLGLRKKPVINFIGNVIKHESSIIHLIQNSYMPEEMKQQACSVV